MTLFKSVMSLLYKVSRFKNLHGKRMPFSVDSLLQCRYNSFRRKLFSRPLNSWMLLSFSHRTSKLTKTWKPFNLSMFLFPKNISVQFLIYFAFCIGSSATGLEYTVFFSFKGIAKLRRNWSGCRSYVTKGVMSERWKKLKFSPSWDRRVQTQWAEHLWLVSFRQRSPSVHSERNLTIIILLYYSSSRIIIFIDFANTQTTLLLIIEDVMNHHN